MLISSTAVNLGCRTCDEKPVDASRLPVRSKLTIAYVQDADPVADARAALLQRSFYVVGVVEMSRMVPGTDRHDTLAQTLAVRLIEGTSDTGPYYENMRAADYAEIFNLIILRELTRRPLTGGS